MAALVSLLLNGIEVDADEKVFEKLVLAVAAGRAGKTTVADFFRKYSRE